MALVLADRVNETTTTAGTGTLTLAGAVSGYQSFSVIGNANTTYYTIVHQTANEWEVGIGTYTSAGTTLSRDTVLASSAGGTTKVTFSAGTKFVFCDYPAGKAIYQDASGNVGVGTTSPVSRLQVSGTTPALTLSDTSASAGSYSNLLFRNTDGLGTAYNIGSVLGLTTANGGNGALTFYTAASNSNTEKMRITAAGNVGIGTTTPSAFSGYRWLSLDAVNGSGIGTRVNAVDAFWLWSSATDTRFEDLQNKPLLFLINSSEKMRIDTSGNVGIGTTSPGYKLQVSGAVYASGDGSSVSYYAAAGGAIRTVGTGALYIDTATTTGTELIFRPATIERMRLDTSGNLGIGTSSPGTKLDVNGTVRIRAGNTLYFQNAAADANGTITASGGSGSSDLAINASGGNVGIGTSSPGAKLQVNGSGVNVAKLVDTSATGYSGLTLAGTGTQNYAIGMGGPSETAFSVANKFFLYDGLAGAMRMVVDSSGNLGIGTSSPFYKLSFAIGTNQVVGQYASSTHVAGNVGSLGIGINDGGGAASGVFVYNTHNGTYSSQDIRFLTAQGGVSVVTERMRIDSSGYVGIGTTSPSNPLTVSSDISAQVRINAISANVNARLTLNASGTGLNVLGTTGTVPLAFLSGSTEQMRIDTSGNLGIGTSSPSARLSVDSGTTQQYANFNSSAAAGGYLTLTRSGANSIIIGNYLAASGGGGTISADALFFRTANGIGFGPGGAGVAAFFDTSGNLGIGTTTIGERLVVQGAGKFTTNATNFNAGQEGALIDFVPSTYVRIGHVNGASGSAKPVVFMTAGNEVARFTGAGNFGIGTSSPGYKLTVNGDASAVGMIQVTGTPGASQGVLKAQAGSGATLGYNRSRVDLLSQAGTAGWSIYNYGDGGDLFAIAVYGGSDALNITQAGNVGIGATSPSQLLHVYSASTNAYMRVQRASQSTGQVGLQIGGGTSSTDWLMYIPTSSNTLTWFGNSTNLMSLDTSGNLGIGVTPSAWISYHRGVDFGGAGNYGGLSARADFVTLLNNAYLNASNNWTYKNTGPASDYYQSGGAHVWRTAGSGTAGTTVPFSAPMVLDASGRLGVGTTSPVYKIVASNSGAEGVEINPTGGISSGAFLQCYNRSTSVYVPFTTYASEIYWSISGAEKMRLDTSGNLLVGTTTASFNSSNSTFFYQPTGYWIVNHANGTSTGTRYIGFGYNTGEIGSITQSGTTAVLYNTTSDQRLKENITDADSASDLIDAIKVRQFDWKADGTHQRYGMIAQELHEVAPEAVHAPADPDDMMAVDYSKLVPMLIKEIQSLRQRVAQLEVK